MRSTIPRSFLARPADVVAPELLGLRLVAGSVEGRIVEVEAYGPDDPASHAFRGGTARNATMFGPAGHLYVYLIYGMYFCANVVTGAPGEGSAVLVRAVAPSSDLDAMRARRPRSRRDEDLCSGPAKLCMAFGIDRSHDGVDLLAPDSPVVLRRGRPLDRGQLVQGTRIGISVATELPWRWYVAGDGNVSRPR